MLLISVRKEFTLRTRTDRRLFNIARLRSKTKAREFLICDMLADDAALESHSESGLQQLVSLFSHACNEFDLTFSLKKTSILSQDTESALVMVIDNTHLDVVGDFECFGSTLSNTLSLDSEVGKRIAKSVFIMAKRKMQV